VGRVRVVEGVEWDGVFIVGGGGGGGGGGNC